MLTVKEIVVKINQGISYKEAEELITQKIEFHTNAALKAASEKGMVDCIDENGTDTATLHILENSSFKISKESILSAYPKENIQ